jgi:hypothetical protein
MSRMSAYTKLGDATRSSSEDNEREAFLESEKGFVTPKPRSSWRALEKPVLYLSNLLSLLIVFILSLHNLELRRTKCVDPSNTVWCKCPYLMSTSQYFKLTNNPKQHRQMMPLSTRRLCSREASLPKPMSSWDTLPRRPTMLGKASTTVSDSNQACQFPEFLTEYFPFASRN